MAETRGSRALDEVLNEGGPLAERVKARIPDRTTLWRYRNGKTTPPADIASDLDRLTEGRVPASGWSSEDAAPGSAPVATDKANGSAA